ncbi:MAG: DNA-binding transcriptional regulator OxyR, partial [Gammaproteobacteria bacterium]|nr:DNA-binding transcriptional regulator OxyR [Gammaproteobacteria bacterium]
LDTGMLSPPVTETGLVFKPLYYEPFLAALPADSPLTKYKQVDLEVLAQGNLLLLEEGHCLRDQALAVCGQSQPRNEEIKATSLEMLRQMVACGIGATLLPALAAYSPAANARNDGRIVLRPFKTPAPGRRIALVWRNRTPLQETLEGLARTLADNLPKGVTAIVE